MIKKVSIPYILVYILVAVVIYSVIFIAIVPSAFADSNSSHSILLSFLPLIAILTAILWLVLVPIFAPALFRKYASRKLAKSGFKIDRTYKTFPYTLMIDINGGKLAMLFPFSPITASVVPASCIERIWVDDGRTINNTSKNVAVQFNIGNESTRFNTYRQGVGNKSVHLPINHPVIVDATQKAYNIACELDLAKQNSINSANYGYYNATAQPGNPFLG